MRSPTPHTREEYYDSDFPLNAQEREHLRSVISSAQQRCYNPKAKAYPYYGGRGIGLSPLWYDQSRNRIRYRNFFLWAHENGWAYGLQLDRIDNDGNYAPENCHFVSPKENARNKRNNKLISFNGKSQCMSKWAEELGVPAYVLKNRFKMGWSIKDILCRKCEKKNKTITFEGETHTVSEWAKIKKLSVDLIYSRIGLGWTMDKVLNKEPCFGNSRPIEFNGRLMSRKQVAKEIGVRYQDFIKKYNQGKSIEEIIKWRDAS